MIERSFPRGGKKPISLHSSKSFLHEKFPGKEKKSQVRKNAKKDQEVDVLVSSTALSLTYSTLCEGMIILGRVNQATDYDLIISLPGRIRGRVKATDINESYTNLLQSIVNNKSDPLPEFKSLPELYSPGDYVITYVKALDKDDRWRVSLSLESKLVNQNINPDLLSKGSKIVCTVDSVEDHGYVIETGIANTRAFLMKEDVANESQCSPGKQFTCSVKSIKTADKLSTITLSAKAKNVDMILKDVKSLDSLLPGVQLTLTIESLLFNGLKVSFGNGNIGYVNQVHIPKSLSCYSPGSTVNGTLLYIIPTVKFAYFSLIKRIPEKAQLKVGDIVENAKVLCKESNGIFLELGKSQRGIVPFRRTDVNFEKINQIFVVKSEHKCRILAYDYLDRIYTCSTEKAVLSQKHFSKFSFIPGEIIDVTIEQIIEDTGFILVSVGNIIGSVPPEHVSDIGGLVTDIKVGQVVKARVLSCSEKCIKFTLKSTLISSNLPILDNIRNAKVGFVHHGTIQQITPRGMLVKFFGDVAGWIPSSFLDPRSAKIRWNHFIGEVVVVEIKDIRLKKNCLTLNLVTEKNNQVIFKIGELVTGTVVDSSVEGICLRIEKNNSEAVGFLPAGHIAPCIELGSLLAAKTVLGDVVSAVVFATFPTLRLSTSLSPERKDANYNELKVGSTIICSVEEFSKKASKVSLPIEKFYNYGIIKRIDMENEDFISPHQLLYGKVITANKKRKEVVLSTALTDLWDDASKTENPYISAVDVLNLYFCKMKELSRKPYYKNKPIFSAKLGQKVEGIVEKVTEYGLVLRLGDNLQATVRKYHHLGNLKVGDNVKGAILWINFVHELVEVTLLPQLISHISVKQTMFQDLPLETKLRGNIVLITNWFILVLLKGVVHGGLVALPVRSHLNDLSPNLSNYSIGQKVRCFVVSNGEEFDTIPVCLLKTIFENKMSSNIEFQADKKSFFGNNEKNISSEMIDECNFSLINKRKQKREIEEENQNTKKLKKEESKEQVSKNVIEKNEENNDISLYESENKKVSIPECGFSWSNAPRPVDQKRETSSESENEIDSQPKQKKRKQSAAERREQEIQIDREIREREKALSSQLPSSADQFDRLVLANPNSSLVWMQYMTYHLQATEIGKARLVAERAVKTINFREENERLNVWQAWLNLESKFGTRETLDEVFRKAIEVNDASKIYAHMLTVYSEEGKQVELEKMVNTILKKFKGISEMWIKCGIALMKMGLKEKSRSIMQRAVQTLPAREHVTVIVRFAQSENNYGDKEKSQTLFEKILDSYPKRTDVWASYVDSLISTGNIEIARKVLEKSITTSVLPPRKMKVLFKKFINFEEQYGTSEAVENVRKIANDYVKEYSL